MRGSSRTIDGSNTTSVSVREDLAPYIAMSASSMHRSTLIPGSSTRLSPKLAETSRATSPTVTGSSRLRIRALRGGVGRAGVHALEEHAELVAAETGHHVARADRRPEALADDLQQRVPGLVPVAVVGLLELVEVDEADRDRALRADLGQGDLEPLEEQGPVGQPGEVVVEGLVAQPLGEQGLLGDVAQVPHEATHGVVVARVLEQRGDVPVVSVVVPEPGADLADAAAGDDRAGRREQAPAVLGVGEVDQSAPLPLLGCPGRAPGPAPGWRRSSWCPRRSPR